MLIINENQNDSSKLAADFLKSGKIIALATDTVYGLACDASNIKAVENLYNIKKRDDKKPIAILVKNLEAAKKIFNFNSLSEKIAKKFLPGALTIVLPTQDKSFLHLNNNDEKFLGFRIIKTDFIEKLFNEFNGVLALTSANFSGEKNISQPTEIAKIFANEEMLVIDSKEMRNDLASTVIRIDGYKLEIIRNGALTQEILKENENF